MFILIVARTEEPIELLDNDERSVLVPAGVEVIVNISALHRDTYQWGDVYTSFVMCLLPTQE
jgi:hypothetical protein